MHQTYHDVHNIQSARNCKNLNLLVMVHGVCDQHNLEVNLAAYRLCIGCILRHCRMCSEQMHNPAAPSATCVASQAAVQVKP